MQNIAELKRELLYRVPTAFRAGIEPFLRRGIMQLSCDCFDPGHKIYRIRTTAPLGANQHQFEQAAARLRAKVEQTIKEYDLRRNRRRIRVV